MTYIRRYITLWGPLSIILMYFTSCGFTDCNQLYPIHAPHCVEPDLDSEVLLLSDFERGEDPTAYCGAVSPWSYPEEEVQVSVVYEPLNSTLTPGTYSIKLEILNNVLLPKDTVSFVGAGLVFEFFNQPQGIDFTLYDLLEFDFMTSTSSHLQEIRLRLEDSHSLTTPERSLKGLGELQDTWTHFVIPLDTLCQRQWFDPPEVQNVYRKEVLRMVTISVHNGTQPTPTDGVAFFDNITLTTY